MAAAVLLACWMATIDSIPGFIADEFAQGHVRKLGGVKFHNMSAGGAAALEAESSSELKAEPACSEAVSCNWLSQVSGRSSSWLQGQAV